MSNRFPIILKSFFQTFANLVLISRERKQNWETTEKGKQNYTTTKKEKEKQNQKRKKNKDQKEFATKTKQKETQDHKEQKGEEIKKRKNFLLPQIQKARTIELYLDEEYEVSIEAKVNVYLQKIPTQDQEFGRKKKLSPIYFKNNTTNSLFTTSSVSPTPSNLLSPIPFSIFEMEPFPDELNPYAKHISSISSSDTSNSSSKSNSNSNNNIKSIGNELSNCTCCSSFDRCNCSSYSSFGNSQYLSSKNFPHSQKNTLDRNNTRPRPRPRSRSRSNSLAISTKRKEKEKRIILEKWRMYCSTTALSSSTDLKKLEFQLTILFRSMLSLLKALPAQKLFERQKQSKTSRFELITEITVDVDKVHKSRKKESNLPNNSQKETNNNNYFNGNVNNFSTKTENKTKYDHLSNQSNDFFKNNEKEKKKSKFDRITLSKIKNGNFNYITIQVDYIKKIENLYECMNPVKYIISNYLCSKKIKTKTKQLLKKKTSQIITRKKIVPKKKGKGKKKIKSYSDYCNHHQNKGFNFQNTNQTQIHYRIPRKKQSKSKPIRIRSNSNLNRDLFVYISPLDRPFTFTKGNDVTQKRLRSNQKSNPYTTQVSNQTQNNNNNHKQNIHHYQNWSSYPKFNNNLDQKIIANSLDINSQIQNEKRLHYHDVINDDVGSLINNAKFDLKCVNDQNDFIRIKNNSFPCIYDSDFESENKQQQQQLLSYKGKKKNIPLQKQILNQKNISKSPPRLQRFDKISNFTWSFGKILENLKELEQKSIYFHY
ncbi:hypothetical protein M0813_02177 [Anaeramoeba flamelloides]|uniref:Autophagy-related protein 13 N-terminal domain-containing protein n=1 Tax=Anaeramoeba flamelloides TaxID=1746091 RepID=A0ABQ8YQP4_9EUKA|nr:hypothetical protein M0813_02177 [Anaeramoeba flamelloides]